LDETGASLYKEELDSKKLLMAMACGIKLGDHNIRNCDVEPYEHAKEKGGYDIADHNCHHTALDLFNFCLSKDAAHKQSMKVVNERLAKAAKLLHKQGSVVSITVRVAEQAHIVESYENKETSGEKETPTRTWIWIAVVLLFIAVANCRVGKTQTSQNTAGRCYRVSGDS
jgi:hypothetical protein